eukprot:2957185-Pyramimonas_sp.AAC.1
MSSGSCWEASLSWEFPAPLTHTPLRFHIEVRNQHGRGCGDRCRLASSTCSTQGSDQEVAFSVSHALRGEKLARRIRIGG